MLSLYKQARVLGTAQCVIEYSRTYRDYRRVKGWGHYCQVSRQRLFPKVQVLEFEQKSKYVRTWR